ncbi:MORN motif protein (macronuclear) [Tetrahymena thermophila SB210]|uniref:MORN motif protein n=1 Tax=Tetrahymena thermophila (strain SB210) TaxID=312017 RepID=I7M3D0_TETTS|nr:MORN motif protein [Tetrahymena thermophila SB210]EAS02917.2 MORN motif protein [Tetrahymena thermophila SB210]|eukprot:XP_001023162.2 MORN motif protein [Tetrahymena thermophila SB210]
MMDTNQSQKLFPQNIQQNQIFKNSKINIDPQIDNGILQQLGASGINGQSVQAGANGMYGSMNTTILNSQNLGIGQNQNNNSSQPGSGSKQQQLLNLNGNQYGNLIGNINQQNNGFSNFGYQFMENGLSGLGGNLQNGQQQGKQIGINQSNFTNKPNNNNTNNQQLNFNGMSIDKNENEISQAKGMFSTQFKNMLNQQQNQNMIIEPNQTFLMNRNPQSTIGLDQIQLQQEMMKNSGNQLEGSHNFSNSKQNQMQSSQNSNNGLNTFFTTQNNTSPFTLGYEQQNQQHQQKLLILQQQQQQFFQEQLKQPSLISLQQFRKANNIGSNIAGQNSNQSKKKSIVNDILHDVSDVESDVEDKKQLSESNIITNQADDFLEQMKQFYHQEQKEEKKMKRENVSALKQENLQLYLENMKSKFKSAIQIFEKNCESLVYAISQVQIYTAFVQNNTISEKSLDRQDSNQTGDKNESAKSLKQMSNYDKVFSAWENINDITQNNFLKIENVLKLSLEDAIWNFNISYNSQQINEKKPKLNEFAIKKIFDEIYEFSQSESEVPRALEVLAQLKQDQFNQLIQNNDLVKNIIDQSSDYIFKIVEDPILETIYFGYMHKKSNTKQGRGILVTRDQNTFQGYFDNNKPFGPGRIIYSSGNIYEGNFEYGLQHGKGKYSWANGDVYEGNYEKGKRSGRGKFMWKDGRIYEGYLINDNANGFGEYTNCIYSSNKNSNNPYCFEIYKGNWKNNKMDGKGILFVGVQAEWKENNLLKINQIASS